MATEAGAAAVAADSGAGLGALMGAAAGGGGILGGSAYGFYSVDQLTCKFKKFKAETMKLDAALKSLQAKQRKSTTKCKVQQNKVNNLKQV